jgi:transcriptional regulator with XRE-family HTH domain
MATFGQRIRELRRAKGIPLRELALLIDRDFTYLSKIENDRVLPPSAEVIVALATHLGGDAEELAILGDKPPIHVVRQQLAEARAALVDVDRRLKLGLESGDELDAHVRTALTRLSLILEPERWRRWPTNWAPRSARCSPPARSCGGAGAERRTY